MAEGESVNQCDLPGYPKRSVCEGFGIVTNS